MDKTHSKQENTPENMKVIQRLTRIGCLAAVLENKKVPTRTGRMMVLGMKLRYMKAFNRANDLVPS